MYLAGTSAAGIVQDVKKIQTALAAQGYSPGPLDGIMGPKTKAAIQAFQRANGLTADGIVGPLTAAKLFPPVAAALASALPVVGAASAVMDPQRDPRAVFLPNLVTAAQPATAGNTPLPPSAGLPQNIDAAKQIVQYPSANGAQPVLGAPNPQPTVNYSPDPAAVVVATVAEKPRDFSWALPAIIGGVALLMVMN